MMVVILARFFTLMIFLSAFHQGYTQVFSLQRDEKVFNLQHTTYVCLSLMLISCDSLKLERSRTGRSDKTFGKVFRENILGLFCFWVNLLTNSSHDKFRHTQKYFTCARIKKLFAKNVFLCFCDTIEKSSSHNCSKNFNFLLLHGKVFFLIFTKHSKLKRVEKKKMLSESFSFATVYAKGWKMTANTEKGDIGRREFSTNTEKRLENFPLENFPYHNTITLRVGWKITARMSYGGKCV